MKRWALVLGCALSLLGCKGEDSGDGGGGNAGSAGVLGGSSGAGGVGGTAGSGGSSGTAGMGSTAGAGGTAGVGTSGSGGAAGVGGAGGSAGSSGTGGAGGAGGTGGSSGGDACGGRLGDTCDAGSYCNYPPEAMCGRADGQGVCTVLTDMACGEIYQPVCGCDGQTYGNPCEAAQAGMSIDHEGECEPPEGGYKCVLDAGPQCLIALPQCGEGQVPSANGSCFGPCVPIEQCACDGPEDCPDSNQYTCWMSAGHCGPYTQ